MKSLFNIVFGDEMNGGETKTKGLKILQVVSTPPFAWETGGCARVTYDLSSELVKRGNEVTILTTDMYKPNQRYESKNIEFVNGIRFIRYKNISDKLAWDKKAYISPGMIKYLQKNLKEYDIVHLQDLLSLQAIFTVRYCKKNNVPYILTVHGSLPWLLENNLINRVFNKLAGQKILKNAKAVTALNKQELELYINAGLSKNKIELVPNGIDLNKYHDLPKKGEFRLKFMLNNNEKIILYLGRIHKSKGIDLLIEAFAKLLKELDNVKLIIVGPDDGFLHDLKLKVKDLKIESEVLFTGPLYDEDKMQVFVDSDVFVTPSFSGFPITFLESCICGTPIITTNKMDELDWIDKKAGFITEYNSEKILNAMYKILTDEKLNERFSENSKKLVIEKFSWNNIAEKVEMIYRKIIIG